VTSKRRKSPRQSLPSNLSSARYLFFGGKGGVGKTTAASATSLFLLKHAKSNEKILLFSTDPAHSLSDSLNKPIGNQLVEVLRRKGASLFAFEMDSKTALEEFRSKHTQVLAEIAERGTLLDESDISELLNLSLPGLDEVMALFELSELDRSADYSHIVIDTAPSGHTARLLRLPEVFKRMVTTLDLMAEKHRYMIAQFVRRRPVHDEVDQFLGDLSERIDRVRRLLYRAEHTGFALVATPEAMSVEETERYYQSLSSEGVEVTDLIINRVEVEHDDCKFCRARVKSQRPWLKKLDRTFSKVRQHPVPLFAGEVRGIESLEAVGQTIWGTAPKEVKGRSRRSEHAVKVSSDKASKLTFDERRIWIFGGKGGVGKTSAAAAFALSLAKADPKKKVLVFSTDPAHSLSDSFAEPIGPLKKCVAKLRNLDAMEIDPANWFEDLKQRYRTWTDDLFSSIARGSRLEIKFDREAMKELVELTPPGIDEIAALGEISNLVDEDRYQTIVLDTAPTGHLIRFLELPEIALAWVRTFMKLLLKYQNVVHATQVAEELVSLSKSIKRVLALLTDASLCEFVGVAIPERMSLEETIDLARSLHELRVPMQRLLVNGIVPEEADCWFCDSRRKQQLEVLKGFRKQFAESLQLLTAPQRDRDLHGEALLLKHFQSWQEFKANAKRPQRKLHKRTATVKNVRQSKLNNEPKRIDRAATN
jgi:arsenite-transporting ATPase